jgi:hypothetical protein
MFATASPSMGPTSAKSQVVNTVDGNRSHGTVRALSAIPAVDSSDESLASQLKKMPEAAQDVMRFWYPNIDTGDITMEKKWFAGGRETDDEIRQRFGDVVERALVGGRSPIKSEGK